MVSTVFAVEEAELTTPALSEDTILQINDWSVPSEWFRHEFRSTFFRHVGATDVRDSVFTPFRKRMLLHARATAEGLDRDPELQAKIEQRVTAMRAFMDYQVAMVRIDMVNEALMKKLDINITPKDISNEQIQQYFEDHIRTRPGAPSTLADVPPHIMDSIKSQTAMALMEQKLDELIQTWEGEMKITVNRDAIESAPMPEMKGTPPADWNSR
jgi:hypothetical protein